MSHICNRVVSFGELLREARGEFLGNSKTGPALGYVYVEEYDECGLAFRSATQLLFRFGRVTGGVQACRYFMEPWWRGWWFNVRPQVYDHRWQLDFGGIFSVGLKWGEA